KSGHIFETNLLMGGKKKSRISCRLIAIRVSEEIANKRRHDLKIRGKKKGYKPKQESLEMCNWTVMVTNIHSEWLSVDMVLALYSLRWQIEVLFKQIKSQLNIDKIDTSKEHRCRCEIIGRIIMCVLLHRIHGQLNTTTWNSKRREVSMEKLYKRLGERSQIMINKIKNSYHSFICYLSSQLKYLLDFCLKGIQKTRRNILELLEFGPVDKYLVATNSP
ncbi:transposase, partial [bacterium]|nr:transposase [bacterium]